MEDLPAKVVREGGTVMEFDQPRHAYKSVAGDRVCTLIVPADTPVVYPQSSGSWNNGHLRVAEAIVDNVEGEVTRAENAMESGFWYVEGERVVARDRHRRIMAAGLGRGEAEAGQFDCDRTLVLDGVRDRNRRGVAAVVDGDVGGVVRRNAGRIRAGLVCLTRAQ